jgi:hypothetical protein
VTLVAVLVGLACAAPISTMRSPYHLRVVEVRNATDEVRMLKIEPTASQHLGSATTFTGILKPGEVKTLYLYHGLEYDFRILDEPGFIEVTRTTLAVQRNLDLAYEGDSLRADVQVRVDVGEPRPTFADSLQQLDPFGIRRRTALEPDTTNLRGRDNPNRVRDRRAEGEVTPP